MSGAKNYNLRSVLLHSFLPKPIKDSISIPIFHAKKSGAIKIDKTFFSFFSVYAAPTINIPICISIKLKDHTLKTNLVVEAAKKDRIKNKTVMFMPKEGFGKIKGKEDSIFLKSLSNSPL